MNGQWYSKSRKQNLLFCMSLERVLYYKVTQSWKMRKIYLWVFLYLEFRKKQIPQKRPCGKLAKLDLRPPQRGNRKLFALFRVQLKFVEPQKELHINNMDTGICSKRQMSQEKTNPSWWIISVLRSNWLTNQQSTLETRQNSCIFLGRTSWSWNTFYLKMLVGFHL